MNELLLLLTIFLVPLVGADPILGYEGNKVFFFVIMVSISGILWTVRKPKFPNSKIINAGLLFTLILGIASLLGVDPMSSLTGKPPYFQGLVTYIYLLVFGLMLISLKIKYDRLVLILSVSSLIISLLSIKQAVLLYLLHQDIPNYAGRVVSSFGQPNLYSGFLLISLPLVYSLRNKHKWFFWLVLVCSVVGILISESRAAFVLLAALGIGLLLSRYKRLFSIGLLGVLVVLVSIYFSIYLKSGFVWSETLAPFNNQWLLNNSPEKRIILYPVMGELVLKKPLLGYGLENIDLAFNSYQKFHGDRSPQYYSLKNLQIDRSHNYALDLLLFGGILTFLVWLILIGLLFSHIKLRVLFVTLLLYLVWSQFQIQSIAHLMLFWILVSLVENEAIVDKGKKLTVYLR